MSSGGDEGSTLREVMARYPTGVTVVATRDAEGRMVGLTVNSFASVSLEPPLVLVCVKREANSHDPLVAAGGFTVSVLSKSQRDLAEHFAAAPSTERFQKVEWAPAPSGNPVISGSAAWLDCELHDAISAGDHTILLGKPSVVGWTDEVPLLFHRGAFRPAEE